jgi:hypothetical protein
MKQTHLGEFRSEIVVEVKVVEDRKLNRLSGSAEKSSEEGRCRKTTSTTASTSKTAQKFHPVNYIMGMI